VALLAAAIASDLVRRPRRVDIASGSFMKKETTV
jgi:hypothetical protein